MNFSEKWIDWMLLCVKTVSYQFCLNGSLIGPVVPKRGLRQGDPLSPYLFLIYVEGLSNLLDQATANDTIHGCKISSTAPVISHLLFADDSFLFFRATAEETTRIKALLSKYDVSSGQSVNYQKSGIYFSANVGREKQSELSAILGVHNSIVNTKYLGLSSLVGRSKRQVFGYLKEKVTKRIQAWQKKPISRAGKTILVKNVLQEIPAYSMACFLMPRTLCHELEVMFNSYWWRTDSSSNRGLNWLSWGNMCMSKMKGGLGFRDLYGFNIALLSKNCWNFINNPHSLVSRVYKARYFANTHMLNAKKGQNPSFIWQGIMTAKSELAKGFRWVMGDGESIVATKDPWLRLKADFCVENSHIYEGRNEVVSAYIEQDTLKWNVPLITENFVSRDAQAILSIPIPQRSTRDRLVWSSSITGIYTAKEGYRFWQKQANDSHNIQQSRGWQKIWSLLIPHKIKIFIWRFCHNILPTR